MAAAVVVIFGLKFAAPMVTQLLIIAFLVIVLSPVYYFLNRHRFPPWLAVTLLILSLTLGVVVGVGKLAFSFTQLGRNLQEYNNDAHEAIADCNRWLRRNDIDVEIPEKLYDDLFVIAPPSDAGYPPLPSRASPVQQALFSMVKGMMSRGFLVILVVSFALCELPSLPRRFAKSKSLSEDSKQRIISVVADARHFMGIKTGISLATGGLVYIGLVLMKVDSALLLGLTAFLLNYIPGVGSIVASIPAILLALANGGGFPRAAAVAALYLVVNQLLGNVLEPKLMGHGFGVSPVIVLVSMIFWGFVLGPVGMLLSVPLTMATRVVLGSIKQSAEAEQEG